jgi:hypothetical protein
MHYSGLVPNLFSGLRGTARETATCLPTHICVHGTCLHQPTGRKLLKRMVGAQGLEPRTICV